MTIWIDGRFVPKDEAKISVYDHGLLYGDGCFEGIRAYRSRVMKLQSHLDRLFRSSHILRLDIPYSRDELAEVCRQTLAQNSLADGYIRLIVTRGYGSLGLNPFSCPKPTVIVIADSISLYPEEFYTEGLPVIVAKRPRIAIDALDPSVKSLNYLNSILAKVEALDAGVHEAIMLNPRGEVAECTGDNIFLVKDNVIMTPSEECGILHGITREYVIEELAPELGHEVLVAPVRVDQLLHADEVFLTGTAAEIIGVRSIDGQPIGSGVVGPVTQAIRAAFQAQIEAGVPEN